MALTTSQSSCSFNITISSLISWLSTETATVCRHPAKFLALKFCGKELHNTNLTQCRVKIFLWQFLSCPLFCFSDSPHSHTFQREVLLDGSSLITFPLLLEWALTGSSITLHKRSFFLSSTTVTAGSSALPPFGDRVGKITWCIPVWKGSFTTQEEVPGLLSNFLIGYNRKRIKALSSYQSKFLLSAVHQGCTKRTKQCYKELLWEQDWGYGQTHRFLASYKPKG